MKAAVKGFWHAALALLCAAPLAMGAEPPAVPKRLSAHIHTMKASNIVELRDGSLTCTTFGPRHSNRQDRVITPTEAQWREFRQTLDDLNVWRWHSEYEHPGILDGMGWSLDIAYDNYEVKSSGANAYPDASGEPNFQGSPTYTFRRYLAALKRLTNGCARVGIEF